MSKGRAVMYTLAGGTAVWGQNNVLLLLDYIYQFGGGVLEHLVEGGLVGGAFVFAFFYYGYEVF